MASFDFEELSTEKVVMLFIIVVHGARGVLEGFQCIYISLMIRKCYM